MDFLKNIRTEQDRLENSSPTILESIILRFNTQFANRNIEKPEITGDLDEVNINKSPIGAILNRVYNFVSPKKIVPIQTTPNEENIITIQTAPK
jgi:hypothetical protein